MGGAGRGGAGEARPGVVEGEGLMLRAQALPSELERKTTSGWSHSAGRRRPEV